MFILCLVQVHSQKYRANINRLGIGADVTFLQLDSDQVNTATALGYAGYLETRGEFNRSLDMIYSIAIFNHNLEVEEFSSDQLLETSLLGAKIKFLLAYRPFGTPILTLEAGPSATLNGEFKFDESQENLLVGSVNPVTVEEFKKTTSFNFGAVGGLSVGIDNFRIMAHYHYNFIDVLDGVDTLGNELEGKLSYVSAGFRLYL